MKHSALNNPFSNSNEKSKSLISTTAKDALAELSNLNQTKSNLNVLINEKTHQNNTTQNEEKNK